MRTTQVEMVVVTTTVSASPDPGKPAQSRWWRPRLPATAGYLAVGALLSSAFVIGDVVGPESSRCSLLQPNCVSVQCVRPRSSCSVISAPRCLSWRVCGWAWKPGGCSRASGGRDVGVSLRGCRAGRRGDRGHAATVADHLGHSVVRRRSRWRTDRADFHSSVTWWHSPPAPPRGFSDSRQDHQSAQAHPGRNSATRRERATRGDAAHGLNANAIGRSPTVLGCA